MKTLTVNKKTFDKIKSGGIDNADQVAHDMGLYNPVQHDHTVITAKTITLQDVGSNLRDMSIRIVTQKAKRYFSAESQHGSESSQGFSNDTIVLAFNSKKARDEYVSESSNISCQKIYRNQVTNWSTNWSMNDNRLIKPRPFSGEFWGIVDYPGPAGCIGSVEVCCQDYPVDRLND